MFESLLILEGLIFSIVKTWKHLINILTSSSSCSGFLLVSAIFSIASCLAFHLSIRDLDFDPLFVLEMDALDPGPFLDTSSRPSSSLALLTELAVADPFILPDDEERSAGLC